MIGEHEEPTERMSGMASSIKEITPLGRRLRQLRNEFIAQGGKLLNREELELELAERRGGLYLLKDEDQNIR